jgi:hypothetical protein
VAEEAHELPSEIGQDAAICNLSGASESDVVILRARRLARVARLLLQRRLVLIRDMLDQAFGSTFWLTY